MKFDLSAANPFHPFRQIPNGKILENVLRERLPYSAEVYNMMRMEETWGSVMNLRWFTLHGTVCPDSWIVVVFEREEKFLQYGFSQSKDLDVVSTSIDEFKAALIASPVIDVSKPYLMTALSGKVSESIAEALEAKTGKAAGRSPTYKFWMQVDAALSLDVGRESGAKLLVENWPYGREGSIDYVRNQVTHFPSAGVYVGDQAVSGVITKRDGNIGLTFTDQNHRRKGYGALSTKSLTKTWGQMGLVPCLHVVIGNDDSKKFHENIGYQLTYDIDYLYPLDIYS